MSRFFLESDNGIVRIVDKSEGGIIVTACSKKSGRKKHWVSPNGTAEDMTKLFQEQGFKIVERFDH